MTRARPLWLLSLPLALGGCVIGHALGYSLAGEPHQDRALHGYLAHTPLMAAVLACLAVCALTLRAAGRLRGRPSPLPFALLPPLAFLVQETAERAGSGISLHTLLEPAAVLGLLAQLPLAFAAWLLARVLLRAADAVTVILRGRAHARLRSAKRSWSTSGIALLSPRIPALGYAGRAPPAL